ncbi:MAG: transcriptional regulator, partial [Solirubrobacterales bacterium]|nr:transcriptional regulator [Solirubrobacterales bacterium]
MSDVEALRRPPHGEWGEEALAIVAALRPRHREFAAETVVAIRTEIERYAEQDSPQFWSELKAHVEDHFRTFLDATGDGELVTREALSFIRAPAASRARTGIPVGDFMHAFRIGQRVLWEAMLAEAAARGAPEAAIALATPWMAYVDLVSTLASETYLEAQQHLLSSANRLRRDLLEDVISGREPGSRTAATAAEHGLGPDVSALVVVAVAAERLDDHGFSAAAVALARALAPSRRPLALVRGDEVVVIAPISERESRDAALRVVAAQERLAGERIVLAVGVSTVAGDRAELTGAYAEARAAAGRAP